MIRWFVALLASLPTLAWAQGANTFKATGFNLDVQRPNEVNDGARLFCDEFGNGCVPLNRAVCDGTSGERLLEVLLQPTINVPADSRLYVWIETGECNWANETDKPEITTNGLAEQSLDANDPLVDGSAMTYPDEFEGASKLLRVSDLAAVVGACEADGVQRTKYNLCFGVSLASTGGTADDVVSSSEPSATLTFMVDTVSPPTPTSVSVKPGDGRLTLKVDLGDSSVDDIREWKIRRHTVVDPATTPVDPAEDCSAWPTDGDYAESRSTPQGDTGDASFELKVPNGQAYDLCVAAVDRAGNEGGWSLVVRGQPNDECDFVECYPGGAPVGYCGAGSSSGLGALFAAAFLLRRRRRTPHAMLAALIVLAAPAGAGAQSLTTSLEAPPRKEAQPTWGLELRAGPYRPRIGGGEEQLYYRHIYATPERKDDSLFRHQPLLKQLEGAWYLSDAYGLLGLTFHAGVWNVTANTRVCGPDDAPTKCTTQEVLDGTSRRGNDKTTLTVLPLGVGGVYRMDLAKRRWGVPLVPYAKGGVDYYFWWNTAGGRVSRASDGSGGTDPGQGGSLGLAGSLGVSLNLDWIEPATASRSRAGIGLADSYVFFEYTWLKGDLESDKLDMSHDHGVVGLAVDFL